jgi:riboflavin biosynthesis pyrimidine reductase
MGMTVPLKPLEILYEDAPPRSSHLPEDLEAAYGGPLGFDGPRLYANFVSSVDGVVALPRHPESSALIGERNEADRFVMGLLRTFADAVLIGSGTLRDSPKSLWRPERVYPRAAEGFAELRRRLGRVPQPQLVVITGSGAIDANHPALEEGALVLTTANGAARLADRLPPNSEVAALPGDSAVDLRAAIEFLRGRGHSLVLSEAGPTVTGSLIADGLVDELFLTISPLFAGRLARSDRPGLVEGVELLPDTRVAGRLLSVRRAGDVLFLRYRLSSGT